MLPSLSKPVSMALHEKERIFNENLEEKFIEIDRETKKKFIPNEKLLKYFDKLDFVSGDDEKMVKQMEKNSLPPFNTKDEDDASRKFRILLSSKMMKLEVLSALPFFKERVFNVKIELENVSQANIANAPFTVRLKVDFEKRQAEFNFSCEEFERLFKTISGRLNFMSIQADDTVALYKKSIEELPESRVFFEMYCRATLTGRSNRLHATGVNVKEQLIECQQKQSEVEELMISTKSVDKELTQLPVVKELATINKAYTSMIQQSETAMAELKEMSSHGSSSKDYLKAAQCFIEIRSKKLHHLQQMATTFEKTNQDAIKIATERKEREILYRKLIISAPKVDRAIAFLQTANENTNFHAMTDITFQASTSVANGFIGLHDEESDEE